MVVELELPDDIAARLMEERQDLSRSALEALACEGVRDGVLSSFEVQRLLGFSSRWETEAFLKENRVPLGYDEEDLGQDRATLETLFHG